MKDNIKKIFHELMKDKKPLRLTPKPAKAAGLRVERLEAQFQQDCHVWIVNTYGPDRFKYNYWHTPNETPTSDREKSRIRAKGVKRGVPDLTFMINKKMYFVELKIGGNKQSSDQVAFEKEAKKQGHEYILIYHLDFFKLWFMGVIGL